MTCCSSCMAHHIHRCGQCALRHVEAPCTLESSCHHIHHPSSGTAASAPSDAWMHCVPCSRSHVAQSAALTSAAPTSPQGHRQAVAAITGAWPCCDCCPPADPVRRLPCLQSAQIRRCAEQPLAAPFWTAQLSPFWSAPPQVTCCTFCIVRSSKCSHRGLDMLRPRGCAAHYPAHPGRCYHRQQ